MSAWLVLALVATSQTPLVAAEKSSAGKSRMVAVFGHAIAGKEIPPGWSFEWNSNGPIGDPSARVPLVDVEIPSGPNRKLLVRGVPGADGKLAPATPSINQFATILGGRDADGTPRYAAATYVMQEDSAGDLWVNHGNLLNKSLELTDLKIHLNGKLQLEKSVPKGRTPTLFQTNLGRLKKGDAVQVAVGPAEGSASGGGKLYFVLEEFKDGHQPGPPVNIAGPDLQDSVPQYDPDGTYRNYAVEHAQQVATLIEQQPELVFIGDSITSRWPDELLNQHFEKYRPVKLGIGGDWIQHARWRVENGALEKAPIKVIVLLLGTNNLSNGFSPEEIAQGMARLVESIQERTPKSKILLLGLLPRDAPFDERVRSTNRHLVQLADSNANVTFLDVGDSLREQDGSVSSEVMPDRLHVALPGYLRWVEAMEPAVEKLFVEIHRRPGS